MAKRESATPPGWDLTALSRLRRRIQCASSPWLHGEVAKRMAERISLVKTPPDSVLDWSLGDGASLAQLRQACPAARLQTVRPADAPALDASHTRQEAEWRWGGWWRKRPDHSISADALAPESVGLLWSNMCLQLEPDPQQTFRLWRGALKPEGFLLFSTFGPGSLAWFRELYAAQGWGPPHAPPTDMHDLGDMMLEAGLADPVMDQETLTLTFETPEALIREMRTLGANLSSARFPGCRTPRWRQVLHRELERSRDPSGRIALDLEIVYGHAFRANDRGPTVAPTTFIDLENLKLMLLKKGRGTPLG